MYQLQVWPAKMLQPLGAFKLKAISKIMTRAGLALFVMVHIFSRINFRADYLSKWPTSITVTIELVGFSFVKLPCN